MPGSDIGEDCLFVNVFKPSNATPDSKLPVWLFIQGGGYSNNANNNFNGTDLVAKSNQNIVFVNFNYRVGALGFLAGQAVRDNGDLNAGLLDQRKVMHWVKDNIDQVSKTSLFSAFSNFLASVLYVLLLLFFVLFVNSSLIEFSSTIVWRWSQPSHHSRRFSRRWFCSHSSHSIRSEKG